MIDYQIQPNTRKCALSGRELQPGQKFYSVLFQEAGKLIRQDYSSEAWQGPPEGVIAFWSGRVAALEPGRRMRIDDDLLVDCFQRLERQDEAAQVNFRYVLALLLMRRKRFKFEEARVEDGREILALRCSRTGNEYLVVNPGLSEEEMMAVQEEVFRVLGWE
jgi:hypothetical protein